MDLSLRNKRVFVSGSSRGIGLNIARNFVEEGARVVINSRNAVELRVAAESLDAFDGIAGDVSDPEDALAIITKAEDILGGIDVVVCNVGSGSSVPPGQETHKEWKRVFDVNFFQCYQLGGGFKENFGEVARGYRLRLFHLWQRNGSRCSYNVFSR